MLWKRQSKCTDVCVAVVVLLALHWMQTEASPLKEHVKQQKVLNRKDVSQQGIIVFGEPKKASDPSYQADNPGSLAAQQFYGMSPGLTCGNNQMRFTASGKSAAYFTLKQKPPMPLSKVPPSCGYTIEGFPHRLVLHVPYDGCNIDIEGSYYNLPLYWNGHTVKLMCPKPVAPPTMPPFNPWFPWLPFPQVPTTTTASPAPLPYWHMHKFPFYPWYWYHKHPIPFPGLPTPTPSPADPQDPWMIYWYLMHKIPFPGMDPTTAAPSADPQAYWQYWHSHKFPQLPHVHKIPFPGMDPTTAAPSADPQAYWQYWHSHKFPQLPHVHKIPQSPFFPQQQQQQLMQFPITTASPTAMYCPWCTNNSQGK